MDVREFPVLTESDERVVADFQVGLADDAARVLTYLQRRAEDESLDRTATATAIHVGTGVSKSASTDALAALSEGGLIEETTVRTSTPGRPPKAWYVDSDRAETRRRTYERHAKRVRRQGERFAAAFGAGSPDERRSGRVRDGSTGSHGDEGAPVTVALNWRANGLHLPLFAARSWLEADGLGPRATADGLRSIAFETHTGSRAALDAVAAGDCRIGVAGAATLLRERARSDGPPVVPIAVLFQRSTVVLYTTRSAFGGPFDSVEALRGRRVGMAANAETGLLGRLLLEQAGLRDEVELVDVAGEEREALRRGAVDAVTGMYPDTVRFEAAGRPVEVVTMTDQFPVYGPALVATRETLREGPELVESVLAAITAGWARARREPEQAARELVAASGSGGDAFGNGGGGDDAASGPDAAGGAGPDPTKGAGPAEASSPVASVERIAGTFERADERFGRGDAVRKRGVGWHSPSTWQDLRAALAQGGVFDDD